MTDTTNPSEPGLTPESRTREAEGVNQGSRTPHSSPVKIDSVEPRIGGDLWEVDGSLGDTPFRAVAWLEDEDHADHGTRKAPRLIDIVVRLMEIAEVDRDGNRIGCLPISEQQRWSITRRIEGCIWNEVEQRLRLAWERGMDDAEEVAE